MPFDGKHYEGRIDAFQKIDQVIDLLASPDRWCKGALYSPDGRRCIVGAMQAADAVAALRHPVSQAIYEVTGSRYKNIESFNDSRATTHALVLQVLRRAREDIINGVIEQEPPPVLAPPSRARMRLKTIFGRRVSA